MKGQRQNFRSTKPASEQETKSPPIAAKKEHGMFVKIIDLKETMYSDQTGKFPYLSSRGMQYIMVAYHTDPNYIFAEPMRNRTERQMIDAYNNIVKKMKAGGLGIKLHILDNEISAEYKEAIKANGATHQLVPPGDHRRNMAERAIQTFKDHFIGVLAGLHDTFPMHLWCRLVEPAEMQLNLLRQSNITPKISAYAHLHGPHNFMKQPLAPLGCPVLAHEKPDKRGTWSDHAINAWNIGTSMEHHRCFKIYNKTTRAERIADTLFFKHKYLTSPSVTPEDAVVAAAQQLAQAIGGNSKGENKAMTALKEAAKLFENIAQENKENKNSNNNSSSPHQR
ncbi:hypothetical protein ACHAXR_001484, partial [Thalassiosira sp. AJA248-18]